MNTKDIEERFNRIAEDYDSQRKKFIPCFDDYYSSMTTLLSQAIPAPRSILDLGAGTGLLSKFLYDQFPKADFLLLDISEKMLEVAKNRFEGLENFSFEVLDYSTTYPAGQFDLVASGLSIHHLEENNKEKLYKNIFASLPEGGCFVNHDQFNAASPWLNEQYNKVWYESINQSGISEDEQKKWLDRRKLDCENTIEQTINLLKKAGFSTVECVYNYMKFGVVWGFKG